MKAGTKNWVKKIEIDHDTCTGCKTCVNSCFADVLRWDDKAEKPVAAYPEDCVWCLACEVSCPAQCINVVPEIPAPLKESY